MAGKKGFTLLGVTLTAAAIFAFVAAGGMFIAYVTRSKLRSEAKVAVIDIETSLAEVIAARLLTTLSPSATVGDCLLSSNFVTGFTTASVNLPDPSATINLVVPQSLIPAAEVNAPDWFKTAVTDCNGANQAPPTNLAAGVYLFCLRTGRTAGFKPKTSTNFFDSQLAFVQVRAELSSQVLSQDKKVFGIPGANSTVLPALSCDAWRAMPRDQQQLKLSYRIFWKRASDSAGYNQYTGSKMINVVDLRGV